MNFREAFERLKAGTPRILPPGILVSQNNVAKEAGCDPSALRKSRFPQLVADIQSYLVNQTGKRPLSERQRLLKQRQRARTAAQSNLDLKAQRDNLASLLLEANAQVGILTLTVGDLKRRLAEADTKAYVLPLVAPKARPKAMDTSGDNRAKTSSNYGHT